MSHDEACDQRKPICQVAVGSHHEHPQSMVADTGERIELVTYGGRSIVQGATVEILAGMIASGRVDLRSLLDDAPLGRHLAETAARLAMTALSEARKVDPWAKRADEELRRVGEDPEAETNGE